MLDAFIFDMDGTLVDNNWTHVRAWRQAFSDLGYRIPEDRIAIEVGKGGDMLVPTILGADADRKDGATLRRGHGEHYLQLAKEERFEVVPGAEELLAELRQRGMKLVLASSSKKDEIEAVEKNTDVGWTGMFDAVTSADDAESSKPAPDLIHAAVKKLKMSPAQCAMVGDTPYDAIACRNAGVVCLGVLSGRCHTREQIRKGGARAVYKSTAEILGHLDGVLELASPGSARMSQTLLESLMSEALDVAREGMAAGEAPIGALLARGDGTIIAWGYNELNKSQNRAAHAEMVAFARSAGKVPKESRDLILVSTLEPCVMCLGAAMEAAVNTVVYGLKAPADSGTNRVEPPVSPESQMPRIVGGVLADESRKLFEEFLKKGTGNEQQAAFVRQLLELV